MDNPNYLAASSPPPTSLRGESSVATDSFDDLLFSELGLLFFYCCTYPVVTLFELVAVA